MEKKEFIQRYLNKEGYFYRLRGIAGQEEMLVYYLGVKIFELQKGKYFKPNIAFYLPNSKNNKSKKMPEQVVEDYNHLKGANAIFPILHKHRIFVDYAEFYQYYRPLSTAERKDAEFLEKEIQDISKEELETIEKILEKRIQLYSGKVQNPKDFEPTTSEAGKREKEYQLKIMNLLQEGKLSPNPVFGPNTIPFEMEYGIKTNERKKRFAKEKIYIPEGRVDNVFFDGETVNLVEIKIGTAVMDGSNGIHKHLLDIAHCCVKHPIITVADFQNLIQEKGKILEAYGWKNPIQTMPKRLEYNIICGYQDEQEKEAVIQLLKRIDKKNIEQVIRMTSKDTVLSEAKDKKEAVKKIKEYYGEAFAQMSLPELLAYVEKICPTKIWLASEDYTKIEPYPDNQK